TASYILLPAIPQIPPSNRSRTSNRPGPYRDGRKPLRVFLRWERTDPSTKATETEETERTRYTAHTYGRAKEAADRSTHSKPQAPTHTAEILRRCPEKFRSAASPRSRSAALSGWSRTDNR